MKNNKFIVGVLVAIAVIGGAFFFLKQRETNTTISSKGTFSASVSGVNNAKPQEVVNLSNGETYNLTASIVKKTINGQEMKMLAYNGSIPGPLIKVPQGAEITLKFTNNTDVDSTIHSHGVRVENAFDGVPDVTQKPVKPGESFSYTLKFPDAGVYCYHPHVREDYAQELGLYGNFIVEPSDPGYWNSVNREEVVMLDDILIEDGVIARFIPETADHTLMGRFGNVMLVSGETHPGLAATPPLEGNDNSPLLGGARGWVLEA